MTGLSLVSLMEELADRMPSRAQPGRRGYYEMLALVGLGGEQVADDLEALVATGVRTIVQAARRRGPRAEARTAQLVADRLHCIFLLGVRAGQESVREEEALDDRD